MKPDLTTVPLIDLVKQATYLDQELDMKIEYYNAICEEILRRWPLPELEETFKPKVLEGKENANTGMQKLKR